MMKLCPPFICSATTTLEKSFLTMAAAIDGFRSRTDGDKDPGRTFTLGPCMSLHSLVHGLATDHNTQIGQAKGVSFMTIQ